MDAASSPVSALRIGLLRAHYLAPADHPGIEALRRQGEEAIAAVLPQALAVALDHHIPRKDGSLWFVRRLEMDIDVNIRSHTRSLSDALATRFASALASVMEDDSDSDNIAHFPSPAAFLASFLLDSARGTAWSKWYYAGFKGLRVLSTSAAIRTAICEDPENGFAALRSLAGDALPSLIQCLSAADVGIVLEAIAARDTRSDHVLGLRLLAAVWRPTEARRSRLSGEGRRALYMFLMACRERADVARPFLREASVALTRLEAALARTSIKQRHELITAAIGNLKGFLQMAGGMNPQLLASLSRFEPDVLLSVVQIVADGSEALAEGLASGKRRATAFGGVFLLLPFLEEIPLRAGTANFPGTEGVPPDTLVRFLLLLKCMGREHAAGLFLDPVVRNVLGIAPQVTTEELADWQAKISLHRLRRFLATIARWRLDQRADSDGTLLLARGREGGRPIALLLDPERQVLFWTAELRSAEPDRILERLCEWLPAPQRLLCDEFFLAAARARFPEAVIEPALDATASACAGGVELPPVEGIARDLDDLVLPRELRGPFTADLGFNAVAQAVLRSFAASLRGFAKSSFPYLRSNFLDFGASVEEEPTRLIVRMAKPPLHLVLGMAGLTRGSHPLSWQDGRSCELYPENDSNG